MTFGKKLQKLRKSKGWSQEYLAGEIGISRQALSKWEQETAMPDTENVIKISRLFEVSTDYLLLDEYESVVDIPMISRSEEDIQKQCNNIKVRFILGWIATGIGVLGLLILGILASVLDVTYRISDEARGYSYTFFGWMGFLKAYNLGWLAIFMGVLIIVGLGIAYWKKIIDLYKKNQQE